MDPSLPIKLIILAILVLLSGFFSGSESAFFALGAYRVRRLKNSAVRSFRAAQELLSHPRKLISTLLTGNELVNAAIGVVGSSVVISLFQDSVDRELLPLLSTLLVLPPLLVFGEIVPKTLGLKDPERFVRINALPLFWFSKAIAPLRDGLAWTVGKLLSLLGQSGEGGTISEDVFRSMVDAGTAEGVLDAQEQDLIHNVFTLDDVKVSEIMVSRRRVSFMREEMKVGEALAHIETERFSRFPVLDKEGHAVGVLYTKDLLGCSESAKESGIVQYVRSPLIVSPNTNALELFARFRARRTHFGVVIDNETQVLLGVVTLENILEEVFGAIRDEGDVEGEQP